MAEMEEWIKEPTILYEDADVLALNKPAGLMVHGDGRQEVVTLADWITKRYPDLISVGEPIHTTSGVTIVRPGIVHRLDQETSGVILIAKHQHAFYFLKKQFQERVIQKEYRAFVWGHMQQSSGVISEPIGRNKNDFRRWHAGKGIRGEVREAVTYYKTLHECTDEQGERFSFMSLFPKTGRTHQLRVHMKFIQRPIVGDKLYAPNKPYALGFSRVALHAYTITFILPSGQECVVTAPYPDDFKGTLAKCGLS